MNGVFEALRARLRSENGERGSAVIELLVLAPAVILVVMFIAWALRQSAAENEAMSTARSAARAASLQVSATKAGESAMDVVLAVSTSSCVSVEGDVDTTRWSQGWVKVTVRCETDNSGLEELTDANVIERSWTEPVQRAGLVGER